jgi:hypothetical protein
LVLGLGAKTKETNYTWVETNGIEVGRCRIVSLPHFQKSRNCCRRAIFVAAKMIFVACNRSPLVCRVRLSRLCQKLPQVCEFRMTGTSNKNCMSCSNKICLSVVGIKVPKRTVSNLLFLGCLSFCADIPKHSQYLDL